MAQFLFILPEGWTDLPPGSMDRIVQGATAIQIWIDIGNMSDLTTALYDADLIPRDKSVIEAQLFNGDMLVLRLGAT